MAQTRSFEVPPSQHSNLAEWVKQIRNAVAGIMNGKINAKGVVTLTANVASMTLADLRGGPESVYSFMPTTANAKAEGIPYVTARGKQTATLNFTNNAQTDRTYEYTVIG